jgi:transcriptional regulator
MYIPQHFEETRSHVLQNLIRHYPLATLVTRGNDELNANHIPLLLCARPAPLSVLQGHVARSNPILNDLSKTRESLIIFQGPDAYVSPSWYEEKTRTGKVVPTWNYLAVHVYGAIRIQDDPDWLRQHLEQLTAAQESSFDTPWQLGDAPSEYITRMLRGIVGIEITINRVVGKWKLSQNKTATDQQAIIDGLREQARPEGVALAQSMADGEPTLIAEKSRRD